LPTGKGAHNRRAKCRPSGSWEVARQATFHGQPLSQSACIYPGAPHGFVADYRASYRQEAAEDAWNQMTAWFKKYNVLS